MIPFFELLRFILHEEDTNHIAQNVIVLPPLARHWAA
jgi:hypothetical protein